MPRYLRSHEGGYVNSAVRIPETLNHMTQFLSRIDLEKWGHVQDVAARALEGDITLPKKIKPSSLRAIRDNKAFHLITPVLDEHEAHMDSSTEVHRGGGHQRGDRNRFAGNRGDGWWGKSERMGGGGDTTAQTVTQASHVGKTRKRYV